MEKLIFTAKKLSMPVNIKYIAQKTGLSNSTVSRVLNGKAKAYRISESTQKRVLQAVDEFNYIPNRLARGLKLNKTETIGLIIPDISNPFFADIARSIELEARKKGYTIILCDSTDNIHTEKELLNLMQARQVDGIVIAPVGTSDAHLLEIYQKGMPVMVIDRSFPESPLPFITSDNYKGAFEAVSYLIRNGHKEIACIQGIADSHPNKLRIKGYRQALKQAGIPYREEFVTGSQFSKENGYRESRKLFALTQPPSAIFALSNLISLGVLEAARETAKKIPDDISLISFDEQPYSAYLGTPMSTIDQQKHEIGKLAVQHLLEMIENDAYTIDLKIYIPTRLIERESVKNIH